MPVSDDQLLAIGRISVSFNNLEFWVNLYLWVLVNPKEPSLAQLVFEGESFDRVLVKVKKLSTHYLVAAPTWLDRMRHWTDRASKVQRRRNDVLHANWHLEVPTGEAVGKRLLRKNATVIASTSAELSELADEIEDIVSEGIVLFCYVFLWDSKPGSPLHNLGVEIRRLNLLS